MLPGLKFDIDPEVFNYETDENNCFCKAEEKDSGSNQDTNEENSFEDPWEDEDDPWSDEDEDPWGDENEDPWGDENEEETEVEDSKNCYGKGVFHLGKQ